MVLPDAPRGLTCLLVIPLIGQCAGSRRLDGEFCGIARVQGEIRGLLRDYQLGRDTEGENVGSDGVARAVLYDAAHLHAVPCGIGSRGGCRGRAAAPIAPRGLTGFLVLPLIGNARAGSGRLKGHGVPFRQSGRGSRRDGYGGKLVGIIVNEFRGIEQTFVARRFDAVAFQGFPFRLCAVEFDGLERGAVLEGIAFNGGQRLGKHDLFEYDTPVEGIRIDCHNMIAYRHAFQTGAAAEGFALKRDHLVRDDHGRESCTALEYAVAAVILAQVDKVGIRLKNNGGQIFQIFEGAVVDVRDRSGDDDSRQIAAALKRRIADGKQSASQSDGAEIAAVLEGAVPERFHFVGNHNAFQIGAVVEGRYPDRLDAAADGHAGQRAAAAEGLALNLRQLVGENDGLDRGAALEHAVAAVILAERGQVGAGRKGHVLQILEVFEGAVPDLGDGGGDGNPGQGAAALKRGIADGEQTAAESDGRKIRTVAEDTLPYRFHAVGNDDGRQVAAIFERVRADGLDAAADRNAFQIGAAAEGFALNGGQLVRKGDLRKIHAVLEHAVAAVILPQLIQIGIGAEGDVFQILTALERAVSDFGHRVGNGDAAEVGTLIKRRVADRGDVSGKNDPGDRPFEVRPRMFFHFAGSADSENGGALVVRPRHRVAAASAGFPCRIGTGSHRRSAGGGSESAASARQEHGGCERSRKEFFAKHDPSILSEIKIFRF